ncbi:HpcH/HpaI aldolase family protein [Halanaeroarchaeum sulfurireducens]|uniref:2-dehydro-3-deoxyglucarate aldolase n=1 Tax=Halanaeroarchaeum sulfurireducens TaxID=1604004 RepID=A0A0F7PBT7_9EURY|nr:aldolase/citrate lyase family protein [Halanaeroarchaeum sulfurireducens]AKH96803.1 2-dehydro-3-deoxyglucarate aldolase [Halanaeroarchaeum sulfurireducens]
MDQKAFTSALESRMPLIGAWSTTGHPVVLEVLAAEDFDFLVLDGEHSENTIGDLATGVRAIDATDAEAAAVVRVSGPDRAEIRRVLDFGPAGVLVPQIESLAEARAAVEATAYPPEGVRGVAGGRASGYGTDLASEVETANASLATILQIETAGALDDVEEIVALDDLDAIFIGPADLSARLGVFGAFDDPDFGAAIDRIVAAAHAADVPVGTLATSAEQVDTRYTEWGVDYLLAGTDVGYLRSGASTYLDAVDRATEE